MVETKTPLGLRQRYETELRENLKVELGLPNTMQVPKLVKVVVNMGVGEAAQQSKVLDGALADLELITGQKPIITKAKTSISNFRLREGQAIGAKTTLRGNRMYEFLDRLMNLAIPRVRDFRGCSVKAFDGNGNYTLGFTEQLIFPEIDYDKIDRVRGMDITIVTSASDDMGGRALLRALGFPFREEAS
jgi:large subunit ribosomal protein L5